jgi:hypothetical protein
MSDSTNQIITYTELKITHELSVTLALLLTYSRFQFLVNNLVIATAYLIIEAVIGIMTLQFKLALAPRRKLKHGTVEQN